MVVYIYIFAMWHVVEWLSRDIIAFVLIVLILCECLSWILRPENFSLSGRSSKDMTWCPPKGNLGVTSRTWKCRGTRGRSNGHLWGLMFMRRVRNYTINAEIQDSVFEVVWATHDSNFSAWFMHTGIQRPGAILKRVRCLVFHGLLLCQNTKFVCPNLKKLYNSTFICLFSQQNTRRKRQLFFHYFI